MWTPCVVFGLNEGRDATDDGPGIDLSPSSSCRYESQTTRRLFVETEWKCRRIFHPNPVQFFLEEGKACSEKETQFLFKLEISRSWKG